MSFLRLAVVAFLCLTQPAIAEQPRLIGSLGQQLSPNDAEANLRYLGSPHLWKLQPMLGVSISSNGSGYIGAGSAITWRTADQGLFVRVSSIAGIHRRGSGKNLGGPIMFRTALDLGVQHRSGKEFGIGFDHRSSARLYRPNPGLNTVYLFASVPLR